MSTKEKPGIDVSSLVEGQEYVIRWTSTHKDTNGIECAAVGKWNPKWGAFCFIIGNRSWMMRPNVECYSAEAVAEKADLKCALSALIKKANHTAFWLQQEAPNVKRYEPTVSHSMSVEANVLIDALEKAKEAIK